MHVKDAIGTEQNITL